MAIDAICILVPQ